MPRGSSIVRRRLIGVLGDLNKTYKYTARYIGPDRNSAYGPPGEVYASDVPGGGDLEAPQFSVVKQATGVYRIFVLFANQWMDIDGDGEGNVGWPTGCVIEDNYDGAGGLLAAGTFRTVWVSCNQGAGKQILPDNNVIDHGKQARNLTLTVRVREYFRAGDLYGYDMIPCLYTSDLPGTNPLPTNTEYGPWADTQEVTV